MDLREQLELVCNLAENQNLLKESEYIVTYRKHAKELDLLRKRNDNLQKEITTLGSHIARVAEASLEALKKLTRNKKSTLRDDLERLTRSLRHLRIF